MGAVVVAASEAWRRTVAKDSFPPHEGAAAPAPTTAPAEVEVLASLLTAPSTAPATATAAGLEVSGLLGLGSSLRLLLLLLGEGLSLPSLLPSLLTLTSFLAPFFTANFPTPATGTATAPTRALGTNTGAKTEAGEEDLSIAAQLLAEGILAACSCPSLGPSSVSTSTASSLPVKSATATTSSKTGAAAKVTVEVVVDVVGASAPSSSPHRRVRGLTLPGVMALATGLPCLSCSLVSSMLKDLCLLSRSMLGSSVRARGWAGVSTSTGREATFTALAALTISSYEYFT
mmetsp:Transcript_2676/g.5654  ORF Transcript_2676/g.5654 Transcript_2676/m.5654 type:complete len:288 (-) Transcript_2676:1464-2327(-)